MSSIFIETVSKAISDYRQLLRRHLPQPARMTKLTELNLKQPNYEDDVALYRISQRIVRDIETNLDKGPKGYYAYSGAGNFAHYLKTFLSHYIIEANQVIHRTQKASRAFLDSIQLIRLPMSQLTPEILEAINKNSMVVAHYGSEEQCDLYQDNLKRYYHEHGSCFGPLLDYFEDELRNTSNLSEAA